VKGGKLHGLIGQKYYGWGYDSMVISYDRVTANKQFQAFSDSKFDVVCSSNVDQMASMWAAQDFTKTLPECDLLSQ
jgi:ribose transport system substrate-binding protein